MTNDERQTVIQALEAVDALIDHQFTGTSKDMTALQHACDDCREALAIVRRTRKPFAWQHTLDTTEGIKSNRPLSVLTYSKRNPFGVPGVDYSKSCPPVTSIPLYKD